MRTDNTPSSQVIHLCVLSYVLALGISTFHSLKTNKKVISHIVQRQDSLQINDIRGYLIGRPKSIFLASTKDKHMLPKKLHTVIDDIINLTRDNKLKSWKDVGHIKGVGPKKLTLLKKYYRL